MKLLPPPRLACHGRFAFRVLIKGRLSLSLPYFKSPFYALKCIVIAFKPALLPPRREKPSEVLLHTWFTDRLWPYPRGRAYHLILLFSCEMTCTYLWEWRGEGVRFQITVVAWQKMGSVGMRASGELDSSLTSDMILTVPQTHTSIHVHAVSSRRVVKHSYQTSQQLALSFRFQQFLIMCFTDSKQSGGSFNETQCCYLVLGSWFNTTSLFLTTLLLLQFVGITCAISYKETVEIYHTNLSLFAVKINVPEASWCFKTFYEYTQSRESLWCSQM